MLWGKKEEELPEALRGKTPEEIAQIVANAAQLQSQVTKLTEDKTKLEGQVTANSSEMEQVKARMAELEANQRPVEKPPTNEPTSIWSDPDKWFEERTTGLTNAVTMSGAMTARMTAENSLNPTDKKFWSKYAGEIDKTMNGFSAQQRMLPQSWVLALNLVKGQHMSEVMAASTKGTDFFAEGTSHSEEPPKPDEVKLTPDEELACKTFKWDPKRYLDQKKKMVVAQSEKGGYVHFGVS